MTDQTGDILELGAGCGLVGMVAARLLKNGSTSNVLLTDYNATARTNLERNVAANSLAHGCRVLGLDFFDQTGDGSWMDMDGQSHPQVGLILAADILCYSNDATLVASTLQAALWPGGQALVVGPSPNRRFGVANFEDACLELGLKVKMTNILATDDDELVAQTNDYNQAYAYDFVLFVVDKPK